MSDLPFGHLDGGALHICIDMQRLFLEPGPWYCPQGLNILPAVGDLLDRSRERSFFTRFITAATPDEAPGCWRRYYHHWHGVTQEEAGSEVLDLHPQLAAGTAEERIFDKPGHDAFKGQRFRERVEAERPSALVLSGIETDVCVLAAALSAVDLGYRTIVATDAVTSSVPEAHDACLRHIFPRFDQQIELACVADILAAWDGP